MECTKWIQINKALIPDPLEFKMFMYILITYLAPIEHYYVRCDNAL